MSTGRILNVAGRALTLLAYTCGGKKSKGRALTLLAYTCGGQKSKGRALTLLAYTCGGQKSNGRANTARIHLPWEEVLGVGPCTP